MKVFNDNGMRIALRLSVLIALLGIAGYVTGCDYNLTSQPGSSQGLHVTLKAAGQFISRWTMETSSSLELSASVTNFKSDSTVTWSFVGKQLGDLTTDANAAIYTSPDSLIGASDTVVLQATSREDTSKFARLTIVIVPAGQPAQPTIAIDPVSASIEPGKTQQFTATVSNAADPSVAWAVIDGPGTVSATGLYTAPTSITGAFVTATIRVTLVSDTTIWTAAEVTVAPAIVPCLWGETRQIIEGNCLAAGCHNATDRKEGLDLTKARSIVSIARQTAEHSSESELLWVIKDATGEEQMPQDKRLSTDQIDIIRKWIQGGMDTTACPEIPPSACDTSAVKYSTFVRTTLQNACLGCHTGVAPTGLYDLSTYDGVAFVANSGQLVGSISHSPLYRAMPDGGQKLDDCTIAKIRAWVNKGAPNN